jgi:CubicO group peptidase (beta-lactamase class C family)
MVIGFIPDIIILESVFGLFPLILGMIKKSYHLEKDLTFQMKLIKKILLSIAILLLIAALGLAFSGNWHVVNALRRTYLAGQDGPGINDRDFFDYQIVKNSSVENWKESVRLQPGVLDSMASKKLEKYGPVAFLVIDNDSIVAEKYWEGFGDGKTSNSFSMAKSIVSLLVGIAIDEGAIQSIDQPVSDFLPEFAEGKGAELRIKHLLQMTSGIEFDEHYNGAFGFMAKAYYGNNLRELTLSYPVSQDPGSVFSYLGGNTLLLSFILEKATGKKPSVYLESKVWSQIGAEHEAYWSVDGNGQEKAYCCIYAEARDFARIGKLYLQKGRWGQKQIVSENYVNLSLQPCLVPDLNGNIVDYYGFQWWMGEFKGLDFFYMRGIGGQYVYVVPEKNLIVVRLGHERSHENQNNIPLDVFEHLEIAMTYDITPLEIDSTTAP